MDTNIYNYEIKINTLKKLNTHTLYSKYGIFCYFMCEPKGLQVGVNFFWREDLFHKSTKNINRNIYNKHSKKTMKRGKKKEE